MVPQVCQSVEHDAVPATTPECNPRLRACGECLDAHRAAGAIALPLSCFAVLCERRPGHHSSRQVFGCRWLLRRTCSLCAGHLPPLLVVDVRPSFSRVSVCADVAMHGRPVVGYGVIGLHKSVAVCDFELTDLALALTSSIVDPAKDEHQVGQGERPGAI